METTIENYLNQDIPPRVCYPLGDRILFCFDNLDAEMEYLLFKRVCSEVTGCTFDEQKLKIQMKLGSIQFIPYQSYDALTEYTRASTSVNSYTLSAVAIENLTLEEIHTVKQIGREICK